MYFAAVSKQLFVVREASVATSVETSSWQGMSFDVTGQVLGVWITLAAVHARMLVSLMRSSTERGLSGLDAGKLLNCTWSGAL